MPERRGENRRAWLVAIAVALATLILFLPGFDDAGPEMDEGVLLSYPSLIAEHGLVPGRDFSTFYGPGQPYLLAGAGEILGLNLELERTTALIYLLVMAMAIFTVLLPLGRGLAALGAFASGLTLVGLDLHGLAILGGLAALLAGLAILIVRDSGPGGRRDGSPGRGLVAPILAGLAAAVALTFRPDLAPAVLLSAAPLLMWRAPGEILGPRGGRWLLALLVGSIPLLAWLAVVGPDGISRLIDDLAASRPGRRLPLPEWTSVEGGLLLSTFVVLAGSIVAAVLWLRRDWRGADGRVLLSIALLLLALLPSTLQRADAAHVLPVAAIAIGLAPAVAVALLDLHPPRGGVAALAAAGLVLAVALAHAVEAKVGEQVDSLSESGREIVQGDRDFRVADPVAASDLDLMLAEIERMSEPGDSLFVGTSDLTRTVYSDTFVYYMLPDVVPASFYTELNPGTASAPGSGLADDLEDADFLLLTNRWEPDTDVAAEPGSSAAQEVVDERFCTGAEAGYYELLVPCERLSGSARER
jgi:hypothetical protein